RRDDARHRACPAPRHGRLFPQPQPQQKSLVLDLKRPAAREALLRLAETADVLVHNMRLGAAARLGIDYTAVAGRHPRIVSPGRAAIARMGRSATAPPSTT